MKTNIANENSNVRGFNPEKFRMALEHSSEIGKMAVGKTGYVVPWAFFLARNGDLYVDGKHIVSDYGGTATVNITRVAEDRYIADFSRVKTEDYGDIHIVDSIEERMRGVVGGDADDVIKIDNVKQLLSPNLRD